MVTEHPVAQNNVRIVDFKHYVTVPHTDPTFNIDKALPRNFWEFYVQLQKFDQLLLVKMPSSYGRSKDVYIVVVGKLINLIVLVKSDTSVVSYAEKLDKKGFAR